MEKEIEGLSQRKYCDGYRIISSFKIVLFPLQIIWTSTFILVRNTIRRYHLRSSQSSLLPNTFACEQKKMKLAEKLRQFLAASLKSQSTLWACISSGEKNANEEKDIRLCSQTSESTAEVSDILSTHLPSPVKVKSILKNSIPVPSPSTFRRFPKSASDFFSHFKISHSAMKDLENQTDNGHPPSTSEHDDLRSFSSSITSSKSKRVTFSDEVLENQYEPDPLNSVSDRSLSLSEKNRF